MSIAVQADEKDGDAHRPAARHAAEPPHAAAEQTRAHPGRRLQVRRSGVHGKGVFALQAFAAGERLIEYTGEVISWDEAVQRHPHDPSQPDHTFYFHLDDERVIDGRLQGNSAKWINHSCDPNCEADDSGGRVFIHALRDIAPGEELFFDYGLVIDERMTAALKKRFACHCGTPPCRGTMLALRQPKPAKTAAKTRSPSQKQQAGKKARARA
ncbi:MAG: SET domain-containing protein-lysine N-methyltransferase [Burkholderiaceae bacterium]|nr:SET domain-containing protein-lysine N-methyltransferase [Burkholderiaceae bacterium]